MLAPRVLRNNHVVVAFAKKRHEKQLITDASIYAVFRANLLVCFLTACRESVVSAATTTTTTTATATITTTTTTTTTTQQ